MKKFVGFSNLEFDFLPLISNEQLSRQTIGNVSIKNLKEINTISNELVEKELLRLRDISHENVVSFTCAMRFPEQKNIGVLVHEFPKRGTLSDVLGLHQNVKPKISPLRKFNFAIDIIRGMNYLHEQGIVHRDLRAENVYVTEEWNCKIGGGVGLSHALPDRELNVLMYHAPELLDIRYKHIINRTNEAKIDVWSFGMLLWEIFSQKIIFDGTYNDIEMLAEDICVHKKRPNLSEPILGKPIPKVIEMCLEDFNGRPSFNDLLYHMENAMVEHFLHNDKAALEFWKRNFQCEAKIPWDIFNQKLLAQFPSVSASSKIFNLPEKFIPLFSTENNIKYVTLEEFQNTLYWFGPFLQRKQLSAITTTTTSENTTTVTTTTKIIEISYLENLEKLCKQKWFWGAQRTNVESGEFVVRLNLGDNEPISNSPFTLCFALPGNSNNYYCLRIWFREMRKGYIIEFEPHIPRVVVDEFDVIALMEILSNNLPFLSKPLESPIFTEMEKAARNSFGAEYIGIKPRDQE